MNALDFAAATLAAITLVAGLAWWIAASRAPARRRQAIAVVALTVVVAAPAVVAFAPATLRALWWPDAPTPNAVAPSPASVAPPSTPNATSNATRTAPPRERAPRPSTTAPTPTTPAPATPPFPWLAATLLLAWATWILQRGSHLAITLVRLRRLTNAAHAPDAATAAELAAAATQVGLPRTPALAAGSFAAPATLGALHPRILLPTDFATWPDAFRRAALVHECAHIAERHPLHGWLRAAADVVAGWHPFVRRLDDALADVQEELADAHVLRDGVDAVDYAKRLVTLAASHPATPLLALGIALHRSNFERRVRRLITKENDMNVSLHPRDRVATALFTGVATFLAVGLAASPQSPTDASYFPLEPGRSWTYRTGDADAAGHHTHLLRRHVPIDGGTAAEVEHRVTGVVRDFSYATIRDDGVYALPKVYIGAIRGVHGDSRGSLVLPFPIAVDTVREYDDSLTAQTEGEPTPAQRARWKFRVRLEITAVGEVVDVPAGRFVCARVEGLNTYHDGRVAKATSWYAPHVGLVKSTANGGTELLAFASHPSTTTADAVLTNALRDAGVVSVAWQWYGVTERRAQLGLRSEFARVQEPDGARLWRVLDDVAMRFDPAAVEDWRRLVAEEGIDLVGSGTAAMAPALLASASAVLHVFTDDPRMKVTGQGTSTTKYEGKDRRIIAVTVVRPDEARVTATFTIDGAEIDSVQITR